MDAMLNAAEAALRRAAGPALRLAALWRQLRDERRDGGLDLARLRIALESRPDRFRVLDPWRGPWRSLAPREGSDPWVVVVGDPGDRDGAPATAVRRLRESVRWLGVTLDAGSVREVGRWHAMVVAEEEARATLDRRAA